MSTLPERVESFIRRQGGVATDLEVYGQFCRAIGPHRATLANVLRNLVERGRLHACDAFTRFVLVGPETVRWLGDEIARYEMDLERDPDDEDAHWALVHLRRLHTLHQQAAQSSQVVSLASRRPQHQQAPAPGGAA